MNYFGRFLAEFKTWSFSGDVAYFKLAFLAYAAAWIVYVVHLFARDRKTAWAATSLIVVGLGLHTASIAMRAAHSGELPSISLYEMVSTTIWGIVCLYLVTQLMSRISTFGAFVMPVALAMMAYAMFLTKSYREMPPVLHSFWLYVHVPISVVAYGALAVVFGLAFAYLFRDGRDNLVWIGIGALAILIGLGLVVGNWNRQTKPPIWIEAEAFSSGTGAKVEAARGASEGHVLGNGWGARVGQSAVWRFRLRKALPDATLSLLFERDQPMPAVFQVTLDGTPPQMSPMVALGGSASASPAGEWDLSTIDLGSLGAGDHTVGRRAAPKVDALILAPVDKTPVSVAHLQMYKEPSMLGAALGFAVLGLIVLAIGLNMTRKGVAAGETRRRQFWLDRLPSLGEMDRIMSRLIALGFVTLTIVILTGALWAQGAWGRPWGWDPKEVASLIPWLFYAVYLHTRYIAGWRGLPSVVLLFFGYFGVIFCLILINLLPTGLHAYVG
jgi:ABC-type transport system involved in cytochrome c biogenesis permease subunit